MSKSKRVRFAELPETEEVNSRKRKKLSQFQLTALSKGVPYEEALKFYCFYQIDALEAEAPYTEALKFISFTQVAAFISGASCEQALKFTKTSQIEALKITTSEEQALTFTEMSQVVAFKAGFPYEQALKFTKMSQIEAFEIINSVEQALTFTETPQVLALKAGIPYEQALKFTKMSQVKAFKRGETIEQILEEQVPKATETDQAAESATEKQQEESSHTNESVSQRTIGYDEDKVDNKQKPFESLENKPDSLFALVFSGLYAMLEILKEFNAPKDIARQIEKRIEMTEETTCKTSSFGTASLDFAKDDHQYSYENTLKPNVNDELIDRNMIFEDLSRTIIPTIGENIENIGFGNLIF